MNSWNIWRCVPARQSSTGPWEFIECVIAEDEHEAIEVAKKRWGQAIEYKAYEHIDNPNQPVKQ